MELVLGVVTDLMFSVRIGEAAKRVGRRAVFVGTEEKLLERLKEEPVLAIVDLACTTLEPEQAIATIQAAGVRVVAFGAHVDPTALRTARAAGAETMPRSQFVQKLEEIIGV